MPLLEVYNVINEYDFIWISEIYFDSLVETEDDNLRISGYRLIRPHHLSNAKRSGVCLYYKQSLM